MKKFFIIFSLFLFLFTSCELFLVEIGNYFVISDEEKNASGTTPTNPPEEADTYTITFDANGGSETMPNQTFTAGVSKELSLNTFVRLGYTFIGWAETSDGDVKFTDGQIYTATENKTLFAKWKANTYTLRFDANGGTGTADAKEVTYDQAIGSLPTINNTGYTFAGWTIDGSQITDAIIWNYTEDKTAIAQWVEKGDTPYTVEHRQQDVIGNGYTIKETENFTSATGASVTPVTKIYTGFISPPPQTVIIAADGSTKVTYDYDRNLHTVRFDARGGSPVANQSDIRYGATIVEPALPVLEGYSFGGWYKEVGLTNVWNFTTDTVTENITLYAKWVANTEVWLDGSKTEKGSGTETSPFNSFLDAKTALPEGGTIWVKGTTTLTNGTHTWNSDDAINKPLVLKRTEGFTGSFVSVSASGNLTLQDITLDGQGGVDVDLNNDGTIDAINDFMGEGDIDATASLVSVGIGGNVTIASGTILRNNMNITTATDKDTAGAIHAQGSSSAESATLNMTGGTVQYNTATTDGGGLVVKGGAKFTMSGGTVEYNASGDNGSGIHITGANTTFAMSGVNTKIHYNKAANNGGGIYAYSSTLNMNGGTIANNTANNGGGFYIEEDVDLTIGAGTISYNMAKTTDTTHATGGGIYAKNNSTIFMSSGSIVENSAINNDSSKANGGGVYLTETGFIQLSGNPQIKNNEAGTESTKIDNNLYFTIKENESNVKITGNLSDTPNSIGLSPSTATDGYMLVQNTGTHMYEANYFSMDDGATKTHKDATGNLVAGEAGTTPTGYAIGDTGPGGGTIFYADNTGAYKEVIVGSSSAVSLSEADSNAEAHEGGGMTDWFLPNKHELNEIYKARQNNATLQDKIKNAVTYWSTTSADYIPNAPGLENAFPAKTSKFSGTGSGNIWIQNFSDGTKTNVAISGTTNAALYIRCVNTKTYEVGDDGPGGGKIFWVGANGAYREVSTALSNADWYTAIPNAEAHNQGEKSDWYLPDIYESTTVYNERTKIGMGSVTGSLSSSSERTNHDVWSLDFSRSGQDYGSKADKCGVRAIRAFNTSSL